MVVTSMVEWEGAVAQCIGGDGCGGIAAEGHGGGTLGWGDDRGGVLQHGALEETAVAAAWWRAMVAARWGGVMAAEGGCGVVCQR